MRKKILVNVSRSRFQTIVRKNAVLREACQQANQRSSLLARVADHLHNILNLDELIARIFDEVNSAIHAEAQSIWLVNDDQSVIVCKFATGPGANRSSSPMHRMMSGTVGGPRKRPA
jgi:hypothetical protein